MAIRQLGVFFGRSGWWGKGWRGEIVEVVEVVEIVEVRKQWVVVFSVYWK